MSASWGSRAPWSGGESIVWASSISHTHKVHTDTVEPTSIIDAIKADLAALFMASSSESFDLPTVLQDRPALRGYGLDVCKVHSDLTAFDRSHALVLLYTTPKYLSSGQEDPSHSVVELMDATACLHAVLDQCRRDKSSLDILLPGLPKRTILGSFFQPGTAIRRCDVSCGRCL